MRWLWPVLILVAACAGDKEGGDDDDDDVSSTGDTSTAVTGPQWEVLVDEGPGGMMLSAFSSNDTMIVVGGQLNARSASVWRLQGEELCVEENVAEVPLWWIHGRSATDFYMVGEEGLIIHEVNGVRTREDVKSNAKLFGVFDDGTDVWAVGGDIFGKGGGEIWRKSAGSWALQSATPGLAFKVWEDWFIGDGFAWRWNGTDFDDVTPPGAPRLTTVRGRNADNDVYVVGGLQVAEFHHYDGSTWSSPTLDPACTSGAFNGIYTAPGEDVFIAGMFGVATSFDGSSWDCAEQPLTAQHFHAIWPHQGAWYAVGGNFTSTSNEQISTVVRYGEGPMPEVVGACAAR